MQREYYSDSIANFLQSSTSEILVRLSLNNDFALIQAQRSAWLVEIDILRKVLEPCSGSIYFEYSIPRMGRRIDVVLLIRSVIFVLEFKVGESEFSSYAIDQVWDYALDLKNFHETSHEQYIAPILIATEAVSVASVVAITPHNEKPHPPIKADIANLGTEIENVLNFADGNDIVRTQWENGRYCPTPTIIESALVI